MSRRYLLLAAVIAGLLLFSGRSSLAAPEAWTTTSFPTPGGQIIESSPIIADIDGDGQDEILVGTTAEQCTETSCTSTAEMRLVVMNPDGSIQWSVNTGSPIRSSPAVGDIDGDGDMEVLVTVGGDAANTAHDGALIAYDHLGVQLWSFSTLDVIPPAGVNDGIFSSPTLCDVDEDGNLEIAFGAWDMRIYLVDHLGNSLWNNLGGGTGQGYLNADTIWSTAACADLNTDGSREIIIGADITAGTLPDGTTAENGGFVYVFSAAGQVLARRFVPETVYSSPAVGDLDNNGTPEIVVGTGYFWWDQGGRQSQSYVYAFDTSQLFGTLPYNDPAKLPNLTGWPQATDFPGFSSPALADFDGDMDLEIVIGTGHPDLANGTIPGDGSVYAWHHTGAAVAGWPVQPTNATGQDSAIRSSPVIADVDNDGVLEVLFAMIWDVHVYNADGSFQERLATQYTLWSSPAVGDADRDGFTDVWIGGSLVTDPDQGYMWRFEQDIQGVGAMPWPMFHRDAQHTGLYPFQVPSAVTLSAVEVSTGTSYVPWLLAAACSIVVVALYRRRQR